MVDAAALRLGRVQDVQLGQAVNRMCTRSHTVVVPDKAKPLSRIDRGLFGIHLNVVTANCSRGWLTACRTLSQVGFVTGERSRSIPVCDIMILLPGGEFPLCV